MATAPLWRMSLRKLLDKPRILMYSPWNHNPIDLQVVRQLSLIFHAGHARHAAFSASRLGHTRYIARQSRITNNIDQRLYALFV
jgi:hypothetical protein